MAIQGIRAINTPRRNQMSMRLFSFDIEFVMVKEMVESMLSTISFDHRLAFVGLKAVLTKF